MYGDTAKRVDLCYNELVRGQFVYTIFCVAIAAFLWWCPSANADTVPRLVQSSLKHVGSFTKCEELVLDNNNLGDGVTFPRKSASSKCAPSRAAC